MKKKETDRERKERHRKAATESGGKKRKRE